MPVARALARGGPAVLAIVLVGALGGCGSDAKQVQDRASSAAGAVASKASQAASAASSALGTNVPIAIVKGRVAAPGSVDVKKGATVRLIITTDKDDQVHVHLDDSEHKIKANAVTTITVVASKVGSFEVETHSDDKVLTKLNVR